MSLTAEIIAPVNVACGNGIRCECAVQTLRVVINRTSRHRQVSFHYPAGNRREIIVKTEWAVLAMFTLLVPSQGHFSIRMLPSEELTIGMGSPFDLSGRVIR